jgi:hypothetical protein
LIDGSNAESAASPDRRAGFIRYAKTTVSWQQKGAKSFGALPGAISTDILAEYQRVATIFGEKFPEIDVQPIFDDR